MSAAELKSHMPDDSPQAIVIWLDKDGFTRCKWLGISKENVANALYQLADEIVNQLPPKVNINGKAIQ